MMEVVKVMGDWHHLDLDGRVGTPCAAGVYLVEATTAHNHSMQNLVQ